MSRLDELYAMRAEIEREIEAEHRALRTMGRLRDELTDLVESPRTLIVRVLAATAHAFGVSVDDLTSGSRRQEVIDARHVANYVLRQNNLTYTAIGRVFRQDHTTAINGAARVAATPRLLAVANDIYPAAGRLRSIS